VTRPIMNLSEIEFRDQGNGERFQARLGTIGAKIGAQKLGYNVTVVPPGKRAFPFHNHRFNEEMFFILEGEGEVRIGGERYPIRAGDVIACPPGPDAHQIINTSNADIRYLAVSTKISPEIVQYPDTGTGKFGILAEYPAPGGGKGETFRFVGRPDGGVDYWEGE
jgi:uncharacterized cupin superfamily protein